MSNLNQVAGLKNVKVILINSPDNGKFHILARVDQEKEYIKVLEFGTLWAAAYFAHKIDDNVQDRIILIEDVIEVDEDEGYLPSCEEQYPHR